jgi:hypothetical protein
MRIQSLLNELRQHPISGTAPDADGEPLDVTVDVSMLFLLMTNLGASPTTYRDLDAAVRAWSDDRDSLPLVRLAAEYNTPFVSDAVDFSYGQYQAVICAEYPILYNLNDSPAKRRKDYAPVTNASRLPAPCVCSHKWNLWTSQLSQIETLRKGRKWNGRRADRWIGSDFLPSSSVDIGY